MTLRLVIHPEAEEEIYEQARFYGRQFSTGEEDFISAVSDTLEAIEAFPHLGKRRFPDTDLEVRSRRVQANPDTKSQAKKFPFSLVYTIYPAKRIMVVYQLWPMQSDLSFREPPE